MAKYHPRPVNPVYPQENFAEYYSFDKNSMPSPRQKLAGVDGWWLKHCMDSEHRPKEAAYLRGKPSGFGHGVGQRAGTLRLSGKAGAHRLGKKR